MRNEMTVKYINKKNIFVLTLDCSERTQGGNTKSDRVSKAALWGDEGMHEYGYFFVLQPTKFIPSFPIATIQWPIVIRSPI
jgi:hypothetical protein